MLHSSSAPKSLGFAPPLTHSWMCCCPQCMQLCTGSHWLHGCCLCMCLHRSRHSLCSSLLSDWIRLCLHSILPVITCHWLFSVWSPPVIWLWSFCSFGVCLQFNDLLFHCFGNLSCDKFGLLWCSLHTLFIVCLPWAPLLGAPVLSCDCALKNEWVFPSHAVMWS
jgi:hypothetical protein